MSSGETFKSTPHRVFGVFRAPETAAVWMILVLLIFFGLWSWIEGEASKDSRQTSLVKLKVDPNDKEQFSLEFTSATPRYLAIYQCSDGDLPQQVFPKLGPPKNLPWPLPPRQKHRLPGNGNEYFRFTSLKPGRLLVLSSEFGPPALPPELWQQKLDSPDGTIKKTFYRVFYVHGGQQP